MSQLRFPWALAVLLISICAAALDQTSTPVVKRVPIKSTSPVSGHEMFAAYCAVCHGTNGKGGGPASSALKVSPPNLTLLSQKNGGKFPSDKVSAVLSGTADLPAHGSKEMPVWGQLFWTLSHGSPGEVQLRIQNLSKYVESLQEK